MSDFEAVLEYWLGSPATDPESMKEKVRRWYAGGADVDREIQEKFGELVEQALTGKLDGWADTSRGALALVILLDQFTRNIYRDTPRAYAGDVRALTLCKRALDAGYESQLDWEARQFLIMPLLHAEDTGDIARVISIFERMAKEGPPTHTRGFEMGAAQARKYLGVIERFGRFPHRNVIFGRESTPEELEFLKTWQQSP